MSKVRVPRAYIVDDDNDRRGAVPSIVEGTGGRWLNLTTDIGPVPEDVELSADDWRNGRLDLYTFDDAHVRRLAERRAAAAGDAEATTTAVDDWLGQWCVFCAESLRDEAGTDWYRRARASGYRWTHARLCTFARHRVRDAPSPNAIETDLVELPCGRDANDVQSMGTHGYIVHSVCALGYALAEFAQPFTGKLKPCPEEVGTSETAVADSLAFHRLPDHDLWTLLTSWQDDVDVNDAEADTRYDDPMRDPYKTYAPPIQLYLAYFRRLQLEDVRWHSGIDDVRRTREARRETTVRYAYIEHALAFYNGHIRALRQSADGRGIDAPPGQSVDYYQRRRRALETPDGRLFSPFTRTSQGFFDIVIDPRDATVDIVVALSDSDSSTETDDDEEEEEDDDDVFAIHSLNLGSVASYDDDDNDDETVRRLKQEFVDVVGRVARGSSRNVNADRVRFERVRRALDAEHAGFMFDVFWRAVFARRVRVDYFVRVLGAWIPRTAQLAEGVAAIVHGDAEFFDVDGDLVTEDELLGVPPPYGGDDARPIRTERVLALLVDIDAPWRMSAQDVASVHERYADADPALIGALVRRIDPSTRTLESTRVFRALVPDDLYAQLYSSLALYELYASDHARRSEDDVLHAYALLPAGEHVRALELAVEHERPRVVGVILDQVRAVGTQASPVKRVAIMRALRLAIAVGAPDVAMEFVRRGTDANSASVLAMAVAERDAAVVGELLDTWSADVRRNGDEALRVAVTGTLTIAARLSSALDERTLQRAIFEDEIMGALLARYTFDDIATDAYLARVLPPSVYEALKRVLYTREARRRPRTPEDDGAVRTRSARMPSSLARLATVRGMPSRAHAQRALDAHLASGALDDDDDDDDASFDSLLDVSPFDDDQVSASSADDNDTDDGEQENAQALVNAPLQVESDTDDEAPLPVPDAAERAERERVLASFVARIEREHRPTVRAPPFAEVRASLVAGAGLGVFARAPLANERDLGFYTGRVTFVGVRPEADSAYVFEFNMDLGFSYEVDGRLPDGRVTWQARLNHRWAVPLPRYLPLSPDEESAVFALFSNVFVSKSRHLLVSRDIHVGDELTIDYGPRYWTTMPFLPAWDWSDAPMATMEIVQRKLPVSVELRRLVAASAVLLPAHWALGNAHDSANVRLEFTGPSDELERARAEARQRRGGNGGALQLGPPPALPIVNQLPSPADIGDLCRPEALAAAMRAQWRTVTYVQQRFARVASAAAALRRADPAPREREAQALEEPIQLYGVRYQGMVDAFFDVVARRGRRRQRTDMDDAVQYAPGTGAYIGARFALLAALPALRAFANNGRETRALVEWFRRGDDDDRAEGALRALGRHVAVQFALDANDNVRGALEQTLVNSVRRYWHAAGLEAPTAAGVVPGYTLFVLTLRTLSAFGAHTLVQDVMEAVPTALVDDSLQLAAARAATEFERARICLLTFAHHYIESLGSGAADKPALLPRVPAIALGVVVRHALDALRWDELSTVRERAKYIEEARARAIIWSTT